MRDHATHRWYTRDREGLNDANFFGKLLLGGAFGQVKLDAQTPAAASLQLATAGYTGLNQTKFAMLVAFPVDVSITKLIGIRVEPGDYVTDFSKTKQNNFRLSVGPVFRFGGK